MIIKALLPSPLLQFLRGQSMKQRLLRGRSRWLRVPPPLRERKVCLLATYTPDGTISPHTLFLAKSWSQQGYLVLLVVAIDDAQRSIDDLQAHPYLAGVLLRSNLGYDFGSWATAIRSRRDCHDAAMLVTTNDSVYGPLDNFAAMLTRVDASTADVIACTDSYELQHHMQSFTVFYKASALRSRTFRKFWNSIGAFDRNSAILNAELPQLQRLTGGGLQVEVLFPATPQPVLNPTLLRWKELIAAGFPFVKVELLRANPRNVDLSDWDSFLAARGFDVTLIRRHLGYAFERSAAGAAIARAP
jgi:lipopolysaccharide biosynthesis protein